MSSFVPGYTTPSVNRQIILARRPQGNPVPADYESREVAVEAPGEGMFLVRNLYLSPDPAQRGWSSNPAITTLGMPMRSLAVGIVVESREPTIKSGDVVYGFFGWQDYAVATRADLLSRTEAPRVPISAYAGVLGMPGMTAWLALDTIAPPQRGQAVLVSTAAGTVGGVVGQIAKRAGAFVVGLTGSDDKVERCVSGLGYDLAFNYKTIDLAATLAEVRPEGFNIYFDNTGGPILDTAIRHMARFGRIIECGTASISSWNPVPTGLRNEREIMSRALCWTGFVIFDHKDRFDAAVDALTDMVVSGELVYDEDIDVGLDQAVSALESVLAGANFGKKLVFIGND